MVPGKGFSGSVEVLAAFIGAGIECFEPVVGGFGFAFGSIHASGAVIPLFFGTALLGGPFFALSVDGKADVNAPDGGCFIVCRRAKIEAEAEGLFGGGCKG
jgi:hypothetical protein